MTEGEKTLFMILFGGGGGFLVLYVIINSFYQYRKR